MSRQTLLVGREREQEMLRATLSEVRAGRGRVVLISGATGIGKTALVEHVTHEAETQGFLILIGRSYDLITTPPYGPWADMARGYQSEGDLPAMPAFVHDPQVLADIHSQSTLFEQGWSFFREVAAHRPLILVLEDLHWADQASLDLLRYLARQVHGQRLLIISTYRNDEITRRHPLSQFLPALIREADTERLNLHHLSESSVRSLVTQQFRLSERDQDRLVSYLQDHAEGNPLYVQEFLRSLEDEGFLQQTSEGWRVAELSHVPLPQFIRQVIEGRLARLGEESRHLLQIGAVIGHEVPIDLWQAVSGIEDEQLVNTIERATEAYLIEELSGTNTFRFRHALIREVLYDGMVSIRRRHWHRLTAEMLTQTPQPDPDVVAYHFQQADDSRAVDWLIAAGERASRVFATTAAIERLEASLSLLEENDRQRGWVLCLLATQLYDIDLARGEAYVQVAEQVGNVTGDELLVAHARRLLGVNRCNALRIRQGLADMDAGIEMLERLEVGDESDAALPISSSILRQHPVETHILRGIWRATSGMLDDALADIAPYYSTSLGVTADIGQADPSHRRLYALATAPLALGRVRALQGQVAAALEALEQAANLYEEIDHSLQISSTTMSKLVYVALPYQTDGLELRHGLVAQLEQEQIDLAAQVAMPHQSLWPRTLPVAFLEGDWSTIDRIIATVPREVDSIWRQYDETILARLAAARGEVTVAWRFIHATLPDGFDSSPGDSVFMCAQDFQRLAIDLEVGSGNLSSAKAWLQAHDAWLDWSGALLGRADGHLLWGVYFRALGDLETARDHAAHATQLASDPRQPLTLLQAHRLLGQLATDAGSHEIAEEHLGASLVLAEACAAPFERALTLLTLAELRIAEGSSTEARSLLDQIRAVCEPLDARPVLEKVDALAMTLSPLPGRPLATYPAGLSAREVEVLRLVAEGLTDAEVANRLYLSPRTVNSHLRSVYNKLGVGSRAAAARFAVENGLI